MSDLLTETHRLVVEIHSKVGGHGATLEAHDQRIERIENRIDGTGPHQPDPRVHSRHSPLPRETIKWMVYAALVAGAGGLGALIHAIAGSLH